MNDLLKKVDGLDWSSIEACLSGEGVATTPVLLATEERKKIIKMYDQEALFRSRISMERYHFGKGEYQYFSYPLPAMVATMRERMYQKLAPIANRWQQALGNEELYPASLESFSERCHLAGQEKPTPLMLRYRAGDYNCLHQDLYGDHVFPIQVVILLSDPDLDFEGGEFVLVEQRPRMQSKVRVVSLKAGEAAIFAVRHRPQMGSRGYHRVALKHGVSQLRSGERFTLGIIFHDAQ